MDALLFSALRLRSVLLFLYEKEEGKVCFDYIKLTYLHDLFVLHKNVRQEIWIEFLERKGRDGNSIYILLELISREKRRESVLHIMLHTTHNAKLISNFERKR